VIRYEDDRRSVKVFSAEEIRIEYDLVEAVQAQDHHRVLVSTK